MWELEQKVEELVNKYLKDSGAVEVGARDISLDYRSGRVYVSLKEDWIAVKGSTSSINYYGGFEYVESAYVTRIGNVTFYEAEPDRVRSCLEFYKESLTQNTEGEES